MQRSAFPVDVPYNGDVSKPKNIMVIPSPMKKLGRIVYEIL